MVPKKRISVNLRCFFMGRTVEVLITIVASHSCTFCYITELLTHYNVALQELELRIHSHVFSRIEILYPKSADATHLLKISLPFCQRIKIRCLEFGYLLI